MLLLLCGVLSLWAVQRAAQSARWQTHTLEVLTLAETLMASLIDAESGQRGYLLTGDERYLDPYTAALASVDTRMGELRQRTTGIPAQQLRLDTMQPLVAAKLAVLRDSVELRSQGNVDAASALMRSGRGRELMDSLRKVLDEFEAEERALLKQRSADVDARLRYLMLAIAASAALAVAIAANAAYRMRRLGEKTRRQADFQQALLDSADAAIVSTSADGIFDSFNRGAERLLGYRAEEMLGKHTPEILHDPDELATRAAELSRVQGQAIEPGFGVLVAVARQGQSETREWTYRRKDGSRVPVLLSVSAKFDRYARVSGYIGVARDISARKEAEEQRDRFFALSLDMLCVASADGFFKRVNPAFTKTLGWSAEELLTRPFIDFVHPDDHASTLREVERQVSAGESVLQFENRYRHKDGSWRVLSWASVPQDGGLMFGAARDVTERKQMDHALVAARDAAELANRSKDSFLAAMSHEIRTPLGGLLGMLELLALTRLDAEQRDTLHVARESAASLLRILNDILDWSKIQAGKLELAPQATSLAQLLAAVVNTYARIASAKSLILECKFDARLSPAHLVDALRLSQVLNNFLSNAIKFTAQGRIVVRADLIERLPDAERVRLSVEDTGIGIGRDARERLFRDYSQESADTARMYGGTGLGLAICRRLADMMAGRIELDSATGQGSTFSIVLTLPVTTQTPVPAYGEQAADMPPVPLLVRNIPAADAPAVLVVDDHPINRKLLMTQLGLLGLRTEAAESGEAALPLWQAGDFAAVITDCHMPKMDGYTLAQSIRRVEAETARVRTPILAWTANALPSEVRRCREAGMDDLLVKPVDLPRLQDALSRHLACVTATTTSTGGIGSTTADAHDAPIDLAELDKLAANAEERTDILRAFLEQTRVDCAELDAALAQSDVQASLRTAHRMKGASRMVGAHPLARACEALEHALRRGELGDARMVQEASQRLHAQLADVIHANEVSP
jgi:PAS domain S-box-containing protein